MQRHNAGALRAARILITTCVLAIALIATLPVAEAGTAKHPPKHRHGAKHHRHGAKHHRHGAKHRHCRKHRHAAKHRNGAKHRHCGKHRNGAKHRTAKRDRMAPTTPANLGAAPGDGRVSLGWSASTDNVGVAGYDIYRNGTKVGSVAAPAVTYTDAALENGVSYSYTVRAYDAAANVSASSTVASATPSGGGGGGGGPGMNPNGPGGTWTLDFDDEFSGTSLDTAEWTPNWFGDGSFASGAGVYTMNANISVHDGAAWLQLSDSTHGATMHTNGDSNSSRASFPVGSVIEARLWFPGNGSQLYGWHGFWTNSTVNYPTAGENDIAEVMSSGCVALNYHSTSGAHNQGCYPGYLGGGWHTFTLRRNAGSADAWLDGVLFKHYTTDDNGNPEDIILQAGTHGSGANPAAIGPSGAMGVDYVRIWS